MVKNLIKLANHLDDKGFVREANYLDSIIKKSQFDGFDKGFFHEESVEPKRPDSSEVYDHVRWMRAHIRWRNDQDNKRIKKINKSIENRNLNIIAVEHDADMMGHSTMSGNLGEQDSLKEYKMLQIKIMNAVDAYEKNN
tara:strand:- start:296 stop:712 length:417 start_codon:yes stop_codon:yes gene_type:complete